MSGYNEGKYPGMSGSGGMTQTAIGATTMTTPQDELREKIASKAKYIRLGQDIAPGGNDDPRPYATLYIYDLDGVIGLLNSEVHQVLGRVSDSIAEKWTKEHIDPNDIIKILDEEGKKYS